MTRLLLLICFLMSVATIVRKRVIMLVFNSRIYNNNTAELKHKVSEHEVSHN
jgi:hypothetical protein